MRASGRLWSVLIAAMLTGGCLFAGKEAVEVSGRGPTAEQLFLARSQAINGRAPTFDEKRQWEGAVEERVFAYLRDHPELQQTSRYSDFRFWWQVTIGSTPAEVRVLLGEPREQTIDPAEMAALAERHWGELEGKAGEAWIYDPGWILYFDERAVVGVVHRFSSMAPVQ